MYIYEELRYGGIFMSLTKRTARALLAAVLLFALAVSLFTLPFSATTDKEASNVSFSSTGSAGEEKDETADFQEPQEPARIHAGYSFAEDSLTADVGGKYPLSTKTFGASALSPVAGYRDGGMSGYVTMDNALFSTLDQFSMGFWTRFSAESAKAKNTLFRVNGKNGEAMELSFAFETKRLLLRLRVYDGTRTALCTYDVTDVFGAEETWCHVAFTYKKASAASSLQLFVNGKITSSSVSTSYVDLSALQSSAVAFQGVTADELYVTDFALSAAKIGAMMNQALDAFYSLEQKEIDGQQQGGTDTPLLPELPTDVYSYSWAAYLFEGSYSAELDYNNGASPATVSSDCTRISSSVLKNAFGHGFIRNEGTAPAYYLKLQDRLLYGQNSFTFSAWVYRNGKKAPNEECLLFLDGRGTLRFAPYAVSADGTPSAYLEYTDSRGSVQHSQIGDGALADPLGEWVHYALTVSVDGTILVYVNAQPVATFSSGLNPAALALADCRVVTGASSSDPTRTVVDEIYVAPRVLPVSEIRKVHHYGLARYTSQALPDPGQSSSGEDTSNPYTPDDTDFAEDAFSKVGMIQNGFIGTTFDDRSALGRDWNEGAEATLTGERLTNGIASYGLSLDGATSFLRYPAGILDGMSELTISLSYNWAGPTGDTQRSQRLFDFSRKSSSVSDPTAYFYLETGLGFNGLKFCISDGISTTTLPYDFSATDTWTRITVTVKQGLISLYLDDTAVATETTPVDLSSICPNFCYIGRSGVKGDPLFKGSVDEIYISNEALPASEVGLWMNGISAVMSDPSAQESDTWDTILLITVIAAVLLLVGVIVLVIVMIVKREKKPKAEIPLPPPPRPGEGPVLGPRSARRARMEGIDPNVTVKFHKVDSDAHATGDSGATATFRKVDGTQRPAQSGETAVFRKVDSDPSDQS